MATDPSTDQNDIERIVGVGATSRRGWWRAGLAAVVLLLAVIGYFYLQGEGGEAGPTYQTEPVTRGGLTVTVTATGTVEPTNQVDISSELSGIIKAVNVDFNDEVEEGQVLAELDTDKLSAQVAHSRATVKAKQAKVAELEATLTEKLREYERVKPLAGRGYSSQSDLDVAKAAFLRAEAAVASGKAEVVVAEADLNSAETNLRKACICSPINGIVLKRNVDPGQTVASSFQTPVLFILADDLRKMQLEVDIDEADIGKVQSGNEARFTVESYQDREFPARISELRYAPETVEGVVTYKAILSIDNKDLLLRPGMTATAEITVQTVEDAQLIPNAALRYAPPDETAGGSKRTFLQSILPRPPRSTEIAKLETAKDGRRRLWVLREGQPVAVLVRTGATDGVHTQVQDGDLRADDKVIVDTVQVAN